MPRLLPTILLLALLLPACGPMRPTGRSRPATCRHARFPFPSPAVSLTGADSGRRVALPLGRLLAVTLEGSPGRAWAPVSEAGTALQRLPNPAQAATVGTQLAWFCAAVRGSATLSSYAGPTGWRVAVTVR